MPAWLRSALIVLTLAIFAPPVQPSVAADITAFTVRASGVSLYAQQDVQSGKIATLEKGDVVIALAQAVAQEIWYLVKTSQGVVGWVLASDVAPSGDPNNRAFRPQELSMWSARNSTGRIFEGTWSLDSGTSAKSVGGTWTLWDGAATVFFRGTWSAEKFSTGWSGVWRAVIDGQTHEYSGSWTADFAPSREPRLHELFEAAARGVIRGVWNAAGSSGSWAIRAAQ